MNNNDGKLVFIQWNPWNSEEKQMQNESEEDHCCIPQVHATIQHYERFTTKMSKSKGRMRLKHKWRRTIPSKIIDQFERDSEIRKHRMVKGKLKPTYNDRTIWFGEKGTHLKNNQLELSAKTYIVNKIKQLVG